MCKRLGPMLVKPSQHINKRETIPNAIPEGDYTCHNQNDSCVTMGSDEFINYDGQNHKIVHTPQRLKRKESQSGIETRSLCIPA